ncbi:toll/interleukin-1 receptor domain-containing protein [Mucilaginibacter celer]|uniref:TIR domain-containing protein n=1 Tax=Mucilaginibacter celer TaxID=2305508 RepID=A0A494VTQ0_9SPHI|nr:toll/interleukin-1 receptor domain-containing protein [Mucilaginibacter celer]AYL96810.1 TIR domain-containing protein [Mucilaginibacter celer]
MKKPTIFLSHSAKDKLVINQLKNMLMTKTSQTVDIFCSSDGQSIPFGKNWIHTVEEALTNSSIMFVFVTPNSIHSNWIYFEAGYSYSKAIEVIPVGLLGVDLSTIQPPLSLLQGFNVASFEGLNNLLKIINTKFSYSYPLSFHSTDLLLLESQADKLIRDNSAVIDTIDYLHLRLSSVESNETKHSLDESAFDKIKDYFSNDGDVGNFYNQGMESHGLSISKVISMPNKFWFEIKIDPFLYKVHLKHLKSLINKIYDVPLNTFYFIIKLNKNYNLLTETFKISSRLHPFGITFSDKKNVFKFENLEFTILSSGRGNSAAELRIMYNVADLGNIYIEPLISMLLNSGVIVEEAPVFEI